jgi:hypothetical protein
MKLFSWHLGVSLGYGLFGIHQSKIVCSAGYNTSRRSSENVIQNGTKEE